jgi:hypothetical protein
MSNYSSFSPNDVEAPETQFKEVFKYVKGDTGPQLRLTITDEETGTATDLTSATVKLHFKAAGDETVLFSKTLFISSPGTLGQVIVNWATGDLDITPGDYHGEIEVVRSGPGGTRETLFDILKFKIRDDFA